MGAGIGELLSSSEGRMTDDRGQLAVDRKARDFITMFFSFSPFLCANLLSVSSAPPRETIKRGAPSA
jgi:hypothetical protein